MNSKLRITSLLLLSCLFSLGVYAAQPMIKHADDRLASALDQVTQSATETPKKHLTNAIADLEVAKSRMDEAKKNKGSHTHVAIEKIDAAIAELKSLPDTLGPRDTAIRLIKDAIKEVDEARRAGKR